MIDDADLDALYTAPLARFIEVRKELAARLRKEGKKEAATEIAAIAKPTPAAWAINQLAREAKTELERLVPAGARLRAAMRAGVTQGADGRKRVLAAERNQREAIAALVKRARELLEASGTTASAPVIERIETTLTTFSTTGGWRGASPGRLSKELDPPTVEEVAALLMESGDDEALEEAGVEAVQAPAKPAPPKVDKEAEKRRLVQEAEAALANAERARDGALRERDGARSAVEAARAAIEVARAEESARAAEVATAERALAGARAVLADVRSALTVAERGLSAAESTLNSAEAERDRAAKRVATVSKT
ncbi:MAG: hypothetical protein HOV80_21905 [Polyangiaceae bacterium]|nr:hypothetical protein [Polyangiaceae bacterium]